MKILHLSYSDMHGGAARAAYRIHLALRDSRIESQMQVNVATSGDSSVLGPTTKKAKLIGRIRPQLSALVTKLLNTGNLVLHSPALIRSSWPERINATDFDVVHLHWVQGEMLSVPDIARIRKPIVWTLHDMWAFCGSEHYTTDQRWRYGYWRDNRPAHESGLDLNLHTWQRKRKHWRRPLQIVCPSQWLADCVRASALMHDWPVTVVPNPIDTDRWQPIDQRLARQLHGLPQDCPLLLFGALGGANDPRKGIDLLVSALAHLCRDRSLQSLQLVVFGQLAPKAPPQLGFQVHYIGHLHDDLSLCALYSAADAFVLSSRQDNLPNTGLEAHACGTPVVAFNTGGMPEIVSHKSTGYLANPFDVEDLAKGIRWVLQHSQPPQLRAQARQRAINMWTFPNVASLYYRLYQRVLSDSKTLPL